MNSGVPVPILRIHVTGDVDQRKTLRHLAKGASKDKVLVLAAEELDAEKHGNCLLSVVKTADFDTLKKVKDKCKNDAARALLVDGEVSFTDEVETRVQHFLPQFNAFLVIGELPNVTGNYQTVEVIKGLFCVPARAFFDAFLQEADGEKRVSVVDLDSPGSVAQVVRIMCKMFKNCRIQFMVLPTIDDSAATTVAKINNACTFGNANCITEVRQGICAVSATCDVKRLDPSLGALRWEEEGRVEKCATHIVAKQRTLTGVLPTSALPGMAVHPLQRREEEAKKKKDESSSSDDEKDEKILSVVNAKAAVEKDIYFFYDAKKKQLIFDENTRAVQSGALGDAKDRLAELKKGQEPHISGLMTDLKNPVRRHFVEAVEGLHRGRKGWAMLGHMMGPDGIVPLKGLPPGVVEMLLVSGREVIVVSRAVSLWVESNTTDLTTMVKYGEIAMSKVTALATNRTTNQLRGNAAIHEEVQKACGKKGSSTAWNAKEDVSDLFSTVEEEARLMEQEKLTSMPRTDPHGVETAPVDGKKARHTRVQGQGQGDSWAERSQAKKRLENQRRTALEENDEEEPASPTKDQLKAWNKLIDEAGSDIMSLMIENGPMGDYAFFAPCLKCGGDTVHQDKGTFGCPKIHGSDRGPKRKNEKSSFAARVKAALKKS